MILSSQRLDIVTASPEASQSENSREHANLIINNIAAKEKVVHV
jgi:hypothetical protein